MRHLPPHNFSQYFLISVLLTITPCSCRKIVKLIAYANLGVLDMERVYFFGEEAAKALPVQESLSQ